MPLIVVLLSPPSRFFLPFRLERAWDSPLITYINSILSLAKKLFMELLAVSPMPSGHHKCGPHISIGTAPCPATQANPELEKSSLKTNKNPIYRYAPKADFEYPKRLWKFAKTTENGKKILQVTYKVASKRLKNFQTYLM